MLSSVLFGAAGIRYVVVNVVWCILSHFLCMLLFNVIVDDTDRMDVDETAVWRWWSILFDEADFLTGWLY